jgi:hypothetical protein
MSIQRSNGPMPRTGPGYGGGDPGGLPQGKGPGYGGRDPHARPERPARPNPARPTVQPKPTK